MPEKNSIEPLLFDSEDWARQRPGLLEGQADDRTPMDGSAVAGGGSPSERRSTARRAHQVKFKEWSKARHD